MLIPSLITMLSVGGVAFYPRFLVALCREWKPKLLRIQKQSRLRLEKKSRVHRLPLKPRPSHAALQVAEMRLSTNFHELRKDPV